MASTSSIVPLLTASDPELERISREGLLSLTLEEMKAIQQHFQSIQRDPTNAELETIAQTWSEHCYHKTFRGRYVYSEEKRDGENALAPHGPQTYENLLKDTIAYATFKLNPSWCLSVFKDNAGVISFDDEDAVCFKVETHNHPSALEPYGGAGTGIGGVIRDVLGCGLGAKPVLNTDVFCFGPLDTPSHLLPDGVLPPKRIAKGVISGVRDYGNRMGIPTANGAVYFDPGYIGNPLVFCGTIGLMPVSMIEKDVKPGDLVVAVGGRTGRDGVHGATFSSAPLEKGITSSVVQIGHAIMEKKTMDVLLQARNKRLYRGITDCGAGGFSSAIGEMGKDTGVVVHLEKALLKYPGLEPWEIWVSESQERMVLAVPPENWNAFQALFRQEDVEAVVLGEFTNNKRLVVRYEGETIADLDMNFLHDGLPRLELKAVWNSDEHKKRYRTPSPVAPASIAREKNLGATLEYLVAHPVISSKESIIRQYDHEVQGGSIIKPLMGYQHDAPTDACVFRPKLSSWRGVAVSNGLNPEIGKWDPYLMAKTAVDEAYRNLIAVGGGLKQAAVLDNFCWGDQKNTHDLAGLVRAAEGAKEAALQYGLPFISGKDSFHNTWRDGNGELRSIPPTLLVSAIGVLEDVRTCVTPHLKKAGQPLYVVGTTRADMKGSWASRYWGKEEEGSLPSFALSDAKMSYRKLIAAMKQSLVVACHDVSEGGIAVALAEMAFGSPYGMEAANPTSLSPDVFWFSETPGRLIVEVPSSQAKAFEQAMEGMAIPLGKVSAKPMLTLTSSSHTDIQAPLETLKQLWKGTLKNL